MMNLENLQMKILMTTTVKLHKIALWAWKPLRRIIVKQQGHLLFINPKNGLGRFMMNHTPILKVIVSHQNPSVLDILHIENHLLHLSSS
jgi:hypothetical protein